MVTSKTGRDTYLSHAKQNNLIQFYGNHTSVITLPVCPKCERIALRDARTPREIREEFELGDVRRTPVTCPQCGYHGYTDITADMYVKQQLYK